MTRTVHCSLKVCYNKIVDRGMCELAGALKRNSTLSEVYIWGNHIGQHTCDVRPTKILTEFTLLVFRILYTCTLLKPQFVRHC